MVKEVVPTVGFQVEEFKRKGVKFTIFDMSGQDKYRSIWENYYQDVQAIIFVIDCSDKIRYASFGAFSLFHIWVPSFFLSHLASIASPERSC
jgi:GTPase SAR1 family protein